MSHDDGLLLAEVDSVNGIPLTKSEQKLGGNVHIKCSFTPAGIRYTEINWYKGNTSTSNRIFYDASGTKLPQGDLIGRDCTTTHGNSEFGLIINGTIVSDDAVYIGRYTQGQTLECSVKYTSMREYRAAIRK